MTDDAAALERTRDAVHVSLGIVSVTGGILIVMFVLEDASDAASLTSAVVMVLDGVLVVYLVGWVSVGESSRSRLVPIVPALGEISGLDAPTDGDSYPRGRGPGRCGDGRTRGVPTVPF